MKKLLLVLTLLFAPTAAFAQCNGVFPNNTICGNISGSSNLPRPVANSALTGVPGGSNGQVQYNNAGTFGGLTNPQLTALCQQFTSVLSGCVPLSGGGTTTFLRADGTWAAPSTATTAPNVSYTPPGTGATVQTQASLDDRIIYVKNYGAVCDGSTDDTAAVQLALNYAAAAGAGFGGTIVKLCPTQRIIGPVNLTAGTHDRICVAGDSKGGTSIIVTSTTADVFAVTASNTCFHDFKFVSLAIKTLGALFNVTGSGGTISNIRAESTLTNQFWDCVSLNGTQSVTIKDSNFDNCANDGVHFFGAGGDIIVIDNLIVAWQGSLGSGGRAGVEISCCGDVTILNSQFVGTSYGVLFSPCSTCDISSSRISATLFDHNSNGLYILTNGASSSVTRTTFTDVDFTSAFDAGIKVENTGGGFTNGLEFTAARIFDNGGDGVHILDSSTTNVRFNGGAIAANAGKGINIAAAVSHITVNGTRIGPYGAWGGNGVNSILLGVGAGDYIILQGDFQGNGANVSNGATGIHQLSTAGTNFLQ